MFREIIPTTKRTIFVRLVLYALLLVVLAAIVLLPTTSPLHMQGNATATPFGLQTGSNLGSVNLATNFTDLTFSNSATGPAMTYFPVGTTQIFARWNFQNVSPETRVRRMWYRDGQLFIQKEDPWVWGPNGTQTQISIYDFQSGLLPGYYHVVISLVPPIYPAAQITGDFVVAGYPATVVPGTNASSFANLTISDSPSGAASTVFPAGIRLVSVRWDYTNIPAGAVLQRDWYLNGVLFRSVQEPWSAYWGSSGRLTHIALYNYEQGLASGNYQLVVFLRDYPQVMADVRFAIGDVEPITQPYGPTPFYNLTFSTSPTGPATAIFPRGTQQVFARWDYHFVPANSGILRRWYRNGVLFIEKQEPWTLGTEGTVQNVSIYDFQNGLLPGDYYVEFYLVGHPDLLIRGYFTIS